MLPPLLPAGHSPAIVPEAVRVFAAMIASGSVQKPSLAMTGDVLFTVIVVVGAFGFVGPAKSRAPRCGLIFRLKPPGVPPCAKNASNTPTEHRLKANNMRKLKRPD